MENKQDIEIIETSEVIVEEPKKAKKNTNWVKNQALFKRGGFSAVITALVLVGLIILNTLVSSLADRFHLEIDMSHKNKNSISAENADFLKNLEKDVNIMICSTEDEYASNMAYFAQAYYMVATDADTSEYFETTQKLISKYPEYNKRIALEYIDPQSTRFTAIKSTYADYELAYGDIIVTSMVNNKERIKVLRFEDIYYLQEDTSSSYYGYSSYTIAANQIETALTSAVSYVTSDESKKVAVIKGHSKNDYTSNYLALLQINNYSIIEISDPLVTSISSECDAIVIASPTIDFIDEEISVIADFLDNNGKKGKGLIFFADATCPSLPNFYSFLGQWGIEVKEGVVFETDNSNHITGAPTTIGISPAEVDGDDITNNLTYAITNYNVPMKVIDASSYERKAVALMQTSPAAVIAPVGSGAEWADYKSDDKQQFDCVIQSTEEDIDPNTNESLTSYVMAFSSIEFIDSDWAKYSDLSNQDIVIACSDRACHVGDNSVKFTAKVIENESFYNEVTETSIKLIVAIFMFTIPLAMIAWGIVVFIRRKNAR